MLETKLTSHQSLEMAAGAERELVRSTVDVVETRESGRYTENESLRDFWRPASGKEDIQGTQPLIPFE